MGNNEEPFFSDETINIYDIWITLKKRLVLILIIFFICNFGAVFYLFFAPKVYKCSNVLVHPFPHANETSLIARSFFKPDDVFSLFKQFGSMRKDEQARVIGLTPSETKMLVSISISREKAEGNNTFKIVVDTLDKEQGRKAIELTQKYLNSLPYIKRAIQQMKFIYTQNMNQIKLVIDNPSQYMNSFQGTMSTDAMASLFQLRERYNEMSVIVETLNVNELFLLAHDTYLPNDPYKPRKSKIILLGFFGGSLVGIGFALFVEWFVRSKREYESDGQSVAI